MNSTVSVGLQFDPHDIKRKLTYTHAHPQPEPELWDLASGAWALALCLRERSGALSLEYATNSLFACCGIRNAMERDPKCLKAYIRAGQAHLGLRQAAAAVTMFKEALQLDQTNAAAQVLSLHTCMQPFTAPP